MDAGRLLRAARHARGVSQRALAKAAGVSQPTIAAVETGAHDATLTYLTRLLQPLNQQVSLIPTRTRPVWEAALDIEEALRANQASRAWRECVQLADDLARERPANRVALAVGRPLPVGDPRYDALIAAITDHRLSEADLPRPEWLDEPTYRLDEPWDVEPLPALQPSARRQTPPAFLRHGVYAAESEFASV